MNQQSSSSQFSSNQQGDASGQRNMSFSQWPPDQMQAFLQQQQSTQQNFGVQSNHFYPQHTPAATNSAQMPPLRPPEAFISNKPSDAEINAILSNYQPGNIDSALSTGHFSYTSRAGDPGMRQLDSATAVAAAAAYSHLGYTHEQNDRRTSTQQNPLTASMLANFPPSANSNWNTMSMPQSFTGQPLVSSDPKTKLPGSATVAGYDGDGSNSASTQTPGVSSDESDFISAQGTQQPRENLRIDPSKQSRQSAPHSASQFSQFESELIEARERRANQDILRSQRPHNRHRRSHSGSQAIHSRAERMSQITKRLSGPSQTNLMTPSSSAIPMGHAASHPPGLGNQIFRNIDSHQSSINAASDFTKRKGWHTRIVDELLDFIHVLNRNGRILYAASSAGTLTGWKSEDLQGQDIQEFIHPDDAPLFWKELDRCFQERCELTFYYRLRKKPLTAADKRRLQDHREVKASGQSSDSVSDTDLSSTNQDSKRGVTKFKDINSVTRGSSANDEDVEVMDDSYTKYVVLEVSGHPYFWPKEDMPKELLEGDSYDSELITEQGITNGTQNRGSVPGIQCFFCSGRVYPTKNVGMLDSFLELKLENERLRNVLGDLNLNDDSTGQGEGSSDGRRSLDEAHLGYHPDYSHSQEDSLRSIKPPNSANEMTDPRTTPQSSRKASLTGAVSNPATSPQNVPLERSLTSNTAGIASQNGGDESDDETSLALATDEAGKRRKKKPKQDEGDYVCTDCGRVDSPEWRKGPLGPKTLCNACGLRWAKKLKRETTDTSNAGPKGPPKLTQHNLQRVHPSHFHPHMSGSVAAMPSFGQSEGLSAAYNSSEQFVPAMLNAQHLGAMDSSAGHSATYPQFLQQSNSFLGQAGNPMYRKPNNT